MKIGIKFCGGCNPVYDRGRRVSRFREAHPEHEYVTSDTNAVCDIWMVVCGCSRRCADTNGLKAGRGIVLLWDEDSFKRLEEEAAEAAREGEAGGSDRRVLHLHEKARRSRVKMSEALRPSREIKAACIWIPTPRPGPALNARWSMACFWIPWYRLSWEQTCREAVLYIRNIPPDSYGRFT